MIYNFQLKFTALYLLYYFSIGRGWTLQLAGFSR
jgi:hypothetical protein